MSWIDHLYSTEVPNHDHFPAMYRVSTPSRIRLPMIDEFPMRQYYSCARVARQLMIILLWLAGAFGIVLADTLPLESQGREKGNFLDVSPRDLAVVPGADSSPVVFLKKPPEKKHQPRDSRATPLVGIIMDDLGYRRIEGLRAINLPGPVTFSIIPHTPHAWKLSEFAHKLGKETLLHMPMESKADHYLEPGGLTIRMTRAQLVRSVHASIASLPHAKGINNHMGSLLTRQVKPMRWLMEAILLLDRDLYFVDSRTTVDTVAAMTARQYGIPTLERDIFLDHSPDTNTIRAQFRRLIRRAKAQGTALGLAHPYPETLDVLEEALPRLTERGVTLVPASTLLAQQTRRRQIRGEQTSEGGEKKGTMEKDKPGLRPISLDPTSIRPIGKGDEIGDSAPSNLPEPRIETPIEPRPNP
uniref:Uncharacterized conserved protein YibQ, putative polysaccharide deacetylase 2 family n=1 Tax=Candidatus Kentrum sp. UNK TaxID=2126344 RepID=A0A451AS02_9GAMM|nr:MAG: Uncharacterized conserved protein YibQ, putative polysaccharide deacetylase 2 family [Candidatus Kentron sp. UNK]VFK73620.1 MAG: Uncharacterized conserved protein YibQ, putative polysaccharide deacetylase 2 family [Candidatus Kentron sp. UNK]